MIPLTFNRFSPAAIRSYSHGSASIDMKVSQKISSLNIDSFYKKKSFRATTPKIKQESERLTKQNYSGWSFPLAGTSESKAWEKEIQKIIKQEPTSTIPPRKIPLFKRVDSIETSLPNHSKELPEE